AKAALPAWNATSWLNFTLTLLPGTLKGFVVPVTSNVSWNGTVEGVLGNGYFAFSVAPGATGTLAVAYPGLIGVNRSLTVPANQTLWENVTLVAPNATLDVQLDPAGAELFVDGARVTTGDRGNASISLVGGKHPIEATANGYYAYFANLTLIPGTIDHVPVNLTAISVPPDGNVSSRAPSPFSDPVVLALVAGVAVLAVVIVLLGRRGRVDPPPPRAPEGTYGADPGEPVEETVGVELPTGEQAGPSA
ncbi:MAG: hypothetical protein L3J91_05090, partial [Thermoplasmata archaeon]|nr:hypothetical protein [Thermoplasmata archaeon]